MPTTVRTVRDPKPDIRLAALEAARFIQVRLQKYPPGVSGCYARTGALGQSVDIMELQPGTAIVYSSLGRIARWVYKTGTGIFGPTGQYITPTRAKVLRWVCTDGTVHFARRVRGFPAWPNLREARGQLAGKWVKWLWPTRGI